MLLDENEWKQRFGRFRGHRAIGVVYHPENDRGNYVPSILASRYDAIIYIDQSKALHPLHLVPEGTEVPDTYPFGF